MKKNAIKTKEVNDSAAATAQPVNQKKLAIGEVNDPLEKEADAIADKVTSMHSLPSKINTVEQTIQRCAECEEDEKIHRKPLTSFIQRKESGGGMAADNSITDKISSTKGGGEDIEESTKSFMESGFVSDFSKVKIHTDNDAAQLSSDLNAKAFTVGNDIYFNQGQYQPGSLEGRHLLAHELAHTLQQSAGTKIQKKDQSNTINTDLEFWDFHSDAVKALTNLTAMNDTDFNDTLASMITSGLALKLVGRLQRPEIITLLRKIGTNGTQANKEGIFTAIPMFNLSPENYLIVFGQQYVSQYGARGTALPASTAAGLVSSDPSAPFTGSGATGISPSQAPMGLLEMRRLRNQHAAAKTDPVLKATAAANGYPDPIDYVKYFRVAGYEMMYDWSNPNKGALTGPGSYLDTLSATTRQDQVKLVFGQAISTEFAGAYSGGLPSRIQIVRAAAAKHNLEPEMVSAIILAEQRDQSKREDASDYRSATIGHRSASSIGLGQITVTTARKEQLMADLVSPAMSTFLNTNATSPLLPMMLASDEFNIFGVARYIRQVANLGATKNLALLPNTQAWVGAINLALYAGNSSTWTPAHIKLLGSEYTSAPFDDKLSTGWGDFVLEAYKDVKAAAIY